MQIKEKKTSRENEFSGWLTFIKENSHKMLTGLLARRKYKSPETFCIQKGMQKESLVSIRVRTAAPAWLCIFHYVQLRVYKLLLKIKLWVLCKLGLPMSYLLSLFIFFFRLIPWSTGALWVHFSARASKTHPRGCPRRGTFHYSRGHLWPTWTVQVPCLGLYWLSA